MAIITTQSKHYNKEFNLTFSQTCIKLGRKRFPKTPLCLIWKYRKGGFFLKRNQIEKYIQLCFSWNNSFPWVTGSNQLTHYMTRARATSASCCVRPFFHIGYYFYKRLGVVLHFESLYPFYCFGITAEWFNAGLGSRLVMQCTFWFLLPMQVY